MANNFYLMLWKNFVLKKRYWIITILEFLFYIFMSIGILGNVFGDHDTDKKNTAINNPVFAILSEFYLYPPQEPEKFVGNLLYTPNTDEIEFIMNCFSHHFEPIGFEDVQEMLEFYNSDTNGSVFAGVEFSSIDPNDKKLTITIRFPPNLRYTIKHKNMTWMTDKIYPEERETEDVYDGSPTYGTDPSYFNEGFLTIQYLTAVYTMNRNFTSELCKQNPEEAINLFDVNLKMKRFPDYIIADLPTDYNEVITGVVFCNLIAYMVSFLRILKSLVSERECQLKEIMTIFGLSNATRWLAWFCSNFLYLLIPTLIMTLILKFSHVFHKSNFFIIFLFYLLYISATITLACAVSTFFSRVISASLVGFLVWISSMGPYLVYSKITVSRSGLLLYLLLSNTGMGFGYDVILTFEKLNIGVQWSNLSKYPTGHHKVNMLMVMGMLFLDTIIYMLIGLYVDAVFPGEQGVPLPWYFPCSRQFWCGSTPTNVVSQEKTRRSTQQVEENSNLFEEEPSDLKLGVQIVKLTKVFQKAVALSNLTLNLYENQITVLLGHNGAGKSTTVSLLIGILNPTSGTAIINGFDMKKDIAEVRKDIGFCLQHNIIFEKLTVRENLYFFTSLRSLPKEEVERQITRFMFLLNLQSKADEKVSKLSGGQQRILSVGVALCGKAKFILLDEPTAGMDPSARRSMWHLLKKEKTGRTILLTTHFMDEADYLGDRIAILAQGTLQCCGSPFFLKKQLGSGYNLVMVKSKKCDPESITDLLNQYIKNIEIKSDIGSELTYILPEDHLPIFEDIFNSLESESHRLGIQSFGISLSTMEDVFLKSGENFFKQRRKTRRKSSVYVDTRASFLSEMESTSICCQILSMLLKRIWYTWRNIFSFLIHFFILPILLALLFIPEGYITIDDLPALALNLEKIHNPVTLVQGKNVYTDKYENLIGKVEKTKDLEDEFTARLIHMTTEVSHCYAIGALFSSRPNVSENIVSYFNDLIYHSDGISLAYALNAISQNKSGQELLFINKPFPLQSHKIKTDKDETELHMETACVIALVMMTPTAFLITFYIKERSTEFKHLQFIAGVKSFIFWMINFLFDFILFLLLSSIIIAIIISFDLDIYKSSEQLERLFFIIVLFICHILSTVYVFSACFSKEGTGHVATLIICFVSVVLFYLIGVLTKEDSKFINLFTAIHFIMNIIPFYTLLCILDNNYLMSKLKEKCEIEFLDCSDLDDFQWESPGIGKYVILIGIECFIIFLLLILNEYNLLAEPLTIIQNTLIKPCMSFLIQPFSPYDKDDDVTEEREKITNTPQNELCENHVLVLKDVTKYYCLLPAVHSLCLGVKHFECFGLLGVNGAGKTTTFKLMSGQIRMTSGDIWINGANIKWKYRKASNLVGYCPQFNGLLEDLKAKEILIILGMIHGLSFGRAKKLALLTAAEFEFSDYLNKKVHQLSGGNKKKLISAVACMGNPSLLLLDEPTTGMDVATRRFLWNILIKNRDAGKSIILSSHSIEECEALCTRVTIMVNGEFRCLGSQQHLKDKFSAGYIITIKIKKLSTEESIVVLNKINGYVSEYLKKATLTDQHEELMTFYIRDSSIRLSKLFGVLQRAKEEKDFHIEDYSLGQGSLEQVFFTFSKYQR